MVDILLISMKEFTDSVFICGLFVDHNLECIASNKGLVHTWYTENHEQAAGLLADIDFSDVNQ